MLRNVITICKHRLMSDSSKIKSLGKEWNLQHYRYFLPVPTRWSDNDMYNHVNNSIYNHCFDTAINNYLIWFCGMGEKQLEYTRFMVKTECQYRSPITYPQTLLVGLSIKKIGKSSLHYDCGLFAPKLDYFTIPKDEFCLEFKTDHKDPLLQLSIGSQGSLLNCKYGSKKHEKMTKKISAFYSEEAAALGYNIHVFTDKSGKPLPQMPNNVVEGCQKILGYENDKSKL